MSIVRTIIENAVQNPDKKAFCFVSYEEQIQKNIFTNEHLVQESLRVAGWISEHSSPGDRVVLLLENNEFFVTSFIACLLSKRVAVALPKPIFQNHSNRISGVIADCNPAVVVHSGISESPALADLGHRPPLFVSIDEIRTGKADERGVVPAQDSDIALLQYTSGSTNFPKGVMVTHGNLKAQYEILKTLLQPTSESAVVSWMPVFHDFGLIVGVVLPLFHGFTGTLFSPFSFVRDPMRWLRLIDEEKADFSAAPNFAFDYCLKHFSQQSEESLNLSRVRCMLNGGEPLRAETLARFESTFSRFGLPKNIVRPAYGLAETTLAISGVPLDIPGKISTLCVDSAALAANQVKTVAPSGAKNPLQKTFVSCGSPVSHNVRIVAPDSGKPVEKDTVGEILIRGESVCPGYWDQPQATQDAFAAQIIGEEGYYLRTGDLGFFHEGELYVCGRLKDTIIVNGANIHPNDIEDTIQKGEERLRGAAAACFSFDDGTQEQVVIVQELADTYNQQIFDYKKLCQKIYQLVCEHHDIRPYAVVLLRKGVPKTSSGKVMRSHCRELYLSNRLKPLYQLFRDSAGITTTGAIETLSEPPKEIRPKKTRTNEKPMPIAVIGMSCRFPQANNLREFWERISTGSNCITRVPPDRWNADALYDPNPLSIAKTNTRNGGFLNAIDQFDRGFFGLSVREATRMDPQHRLMLELSWEALEDAGILPSSLKASRTGVFVGISGSDYAQMLFSDEVLADAYAGLGCALTLAASRVSHFFDLGGPALAIDTACSSSLSAVHLACQSIHSGETEQAFAAGVNLVFSPMINMCLTKAGMMSPDGLCKSFDASANGYVRAEGGGVVLLKPLDRALADGNSIYGVIHGTASNQDGGASGLAVPNGKAQQEVILRACEKAGIIPSDLDYIEAHGTGTAIGDPIEVNAIGDVIRGRKGSLPIGSVKTNFGHSESAAGIAGLIKANLMLRHRQIPPSIHFTTPNPLIDFDGWGIRIPTQLESFSPKKTPLAIGVNSFGVGGTNVHVILRENSVPAPVSTIDSPSPVDFAILPFSAHCAKSLEGRAKHIHEALTGDNPDESHANLLYTHLRHRAKMQFRACAVAENVSQLPKVFEEFAATGRSKGIIVKKFQAHLNQDHRPKIAFVFSGQGMQWIGMGHRLFESIPYFREAVLHIAGHFPDELSVPLIEAFAHKKLNTRTLQKTEFAQPLVFSLQVALANLLRFWGVEARAVIGHSMGEVAAAHIAGMLTLEDAVRLITIRAKLMQSTSGQGKMASVELDLKSIQEIITQKFPDLCIAAINGPSSVVISGEAASVGAALTEFRSRQTTPQKRENSLPVLAMLLPGDFAFHSHLMDSIKSELESEISEISFQPAKIPFFSTVTGDSQHLINASYWGANVRDTVLFAPAIEKMCASGIDFFVELGPHTTLSPLVERILSESGHKGECASALRKNADCLEQLLSLLASLSVEGADLHWDRLQRKGTLAQMQPGYPFNRQRYWMNAPVKYDDSTPRSHALLTKKLSSALPTWECVLQSHISHHTDGVWRDERKHISNGMLLEMALESLAESNPGAQQFFLHDVNIIAPVPSDGTAGNRLQVSHSDNHIYITGAEPNTGSGPQKWTRAVTMRACAWFDGDRSALPTTGMDLGNFKEEGTKRDPSAFYHQLEAVGYRYDASLQIIGESWLCGSSILAEWNPPDDGQENQTYCIHPLAFEALEQSILNLSSVESRQRKISITGYHRLRYLKSADTTPQYIYVTQVSRDRYDAMILNSEGRALLAVDGALMAADSSDSNGIISKNREHWLYDNEWVKTDEVSLSHSGKTTFVIFSAEEVYSSSCISLLEKGLDCRVIRIKPGHEFCRQDGSFQIRPEEAEDYQALFTSLFREKEVRENHLKVVLMWPLSRGEITSGLDCVRLQNRGTLSLLNIIRSLRIAGRSESRVDIYVVSPNHAGRFSGEIDYVALSHSTLQGMGRTLDIEIPEQRVRRIEVAEISPSSEIENLVREIRSGVSDQEVLLKGTQRLVHRLLPAKSDTSGLLANLKSSNELADLQVRTPWRLLESQSGDWQVFAACPRKISETQLSIRPDTFYVSTNLTQELFAVSGKVEKTGDHAREYHAGDTVFAIYSGEFRSDCNVNAEQATRVGESFIEELITPVVGSFMVVQKWIDSLKTREILLIDPTCEEGLGMILLGETIGAKVHIACRSSRREFFEELKPMRIFDLDGFSLSSRLHKSFFAGGRGVDLVVCYDSQADLSAISSSLNRDGAVVEVLTNEEAAFSARNVPARISYSRVRASDLFNQMDLAPNDIALIASAASGRDRNIVDTWREKGFLKESDTIVRLEKETASATQNLEQSFAHVNHQGYDPRGTYVITGGLGGLGLEMGKRLAQHGAGHIVLASRRVVDISKNEDIAQMRNYGARVTVEPLKVEDEDEVRTFFEKLEHHPNPVRGIIHGAGVLKNGLIHELTDKDFFEPFAAKVIGSYHLHKYSQSLPLDFFILFSSLASRIGSRGQANYAAANAFMDSLALQRQHLTPRLPGLSINWGPWDSRGMAAEAFNESRLKSSGFGFIPLQEGLDLLESFIARKVNGTVSVLPMNWLAYTDTFPAAADQKLLEKLIPEKIMKQSSSEDSLNRFSAMPDLSDSEACTAYLIDVVKKSVSHCFCIGLSELDSETELRSLGFNSIISLELKARIEAELKVRISTALLLQGPSIGTLVKHCLDLFQAKEAPTLRDRSDVTPPEIKPQWNVAKGIAL